MQLRQAQYALIQKGQELCLVQEKLVEMQKAKAKDMETLDDMWVDSGLSSPNSDAFKASNGPIRAFRAGLSEERGEELPPLSSNQPTLAGLTLHLSAGARLRSDMWSVAMP